MISCSWKAQFGVECMTCGFQRSFMLLMKGEFVESFWMFPATIPFLACVLLLCAHLMFKFKRGAAWILTLFSVTAVLILINYSVKLYTGDVFH